jgi:tRNA modification GTPase
MLVSSDTDTIVAQASPPGRGGVGVIRVSGPHAKLIAAQVLKKDIPPRYAYFGNFYDADDRVLDKGIALYFKNPHSFTGEDVFEFQGHGGPVIIDLIIKNILSLGARMARPGEFSERAFLNNKLDLSQAEAIADLIDSSSEQAALGAMRTLQGVFSKQVHELVEALIELRMYVEAAIDFPEEEINFLADGKIQNDLAIIQAKLEDLIGKAYQGSALREGMTVVIAGLPNAGKSSLLNALSGRESAIVTDIPGTTRDLLKESIHIDGIPLHIIDTAGLRKSTDLIEQEGIRRAWDEIKKADRILVVVDASTNPATQPDVILPDFFSHLESLEKVTVIQNKIDLLDLVPDLINDCSAPCPVIRLSAKQNTGMGLLTSHLKECIGITGTTEGTFSARRRHLDALDRARSFLLTGAHQLTMQCAGELLAEDLKLAQQALDEITGDFSNDDLLGKIFGSFCIGK